MPQRVGPYIVEQEIGRGGMGVVYRAHDQRLGRTVALKSLPEEFATDPARRERFEREARVLAALSHPNVGAIHGLENQDGSLYLVLEHVPGETLAHRLATGPLPVERALAIVGQIASGLEAAHAAGIVHRDLKPANIMLTPAGVPKVLDFGLARVATDDDPDRTLAVHRTVDGAILGTAAYMAPEQATGQPVDSRADVWALGVIAYECLTGRNPFAAGSLAEMLGNVTRAEIDFDALPERTPEAVRAALRLCLRKDPEQRWRNPGDLRRILDESLAISAESRDTAPVVVERRFTIDTPVCATLQREGLDPRLVGWDVRYSDNERASDTLLVWIPSFGGDHVQRVWRDVQHQTEHRMVVVTLIGLEPGESDHPECSPDNQLRILHHVIRHLRARIRPARVIVGGFSCGGDWAMRVAASAEPGLIDGVLAIGPNLEREGCFITGLFASIEPKDFSDVLQIIHRANEECTTVEEWMQLTDHMVNSIGKFGGNLDPLIHHGRAIYSPFATCATASESPFASWYANALERVRAVRVVLENEERRRRAAGAIRLRHLDEGILGPRHEESNIVYADVAVHMELGESHRVVHELNQIVARLARAECDATTIAHH